MQLIDREANQKLYLQLYDILKKKIEDNEWTAGSLIPTEEELCKTFEVSRATVRTAALELVRQGYLKRHQGKGTFVSRNISPNGFTMYTNFKELPFEDELDISTAVLAHTVMMPVDDLDTKLDISKDNHVIYIKRLYFANNEPLLLQQAYIPHHVCPLILEEDLERNSLLELFEKKYGIKITRATNSVEIAYLDAEEARLLQLPEGSPAIVMNQSMYSRETVVIYSRSLKRNDRFAIFIELDRKAI